MTTDVEDEVSEKVREEQADRFVSARIHMISKLPFFGHLSMYLQVRQTSAGDPGHGTMATDGMNLWYDPKFTSERLDNQEFVFCIAHEVMHAALRHPRRGMAMMDHQLYNIAGDILINEMLKRNSVGKCPSFAMTVSNAKWKTKPTKDIMEYSADELYYMLDPEQGDSGGGIGIFPGWGKDGNKPGACGGVLPPEDITLGDEAWKAHIEAAVKAIGNAPAGMESYIDSLHDTRKNWREILFDFTAPTTGDYTLIPPDRRFLSWGQNLLTDVYDAPVVIESIENDLELEDVIYAVDTSGSMSDDELRDGISEAVEIGKIANNSWLIYCDAAIQGVHRLDGEMPAQPRGRGGTAFDPVFNHVQTMIDKGEIKIPKVLVYFTDGEGYFNFPEPEYPVLWIINNDRVIAPWGTTVPYP